MIAQLNYKGQGIPQNYQHAYDWFLKAAEQGNTDAQLAISGHYLLGLGVPQDYQKSYAWASICAAVGDKDAMLVRDEAAKHLTPKQLEEAQTLANQYFQKYQSHEWIVTGDYVNHKNLWHFPCEPLIAILRPLTRTVWAAKWADTGMPRSDISTPSFWGSRNLRLVGFAAGGLLWGIAS